MFPQLTPLHLIAAELFEVTHFGLAYICLGGFIVAFSMCSLLLKERLYINETVLGTVFGITIGPYFANIVDPRSWGGESVLITREVTRIVLVTGLFAIGVELPMSYMAKHAKSLLFMVVPTMAIGWIIVACKHPYEPISTVILLLILAIAACLTPTDPIVCAAIVGGKYAKEHVPLDLRHILSAESAANDGLAFPFLTISLYLIIDSTNKEAIAHWVFIGCIYQVIMGTVIGAILGLMFSRLMQYSYRRGYIDRESYVTQYLALSIFTAGIVSTLGSDDLLAAFAAGSAISWDGEFKIRTEGEAFVSVIDLLLNCSCFVYIGAWLPFEAFYNPSLDIVSWRLIVLVTVILVFRRIPALLALYRWVPEIKTWREALLSGHFGPMGVGAIFVCCLALLKLPKPQDPLQNEQEVLAAYLESLVPFVVLCSIVIHGLSIPFFCLLTIVQDNVIGRPGYSAIPQF